MYKGRASKSPKRRAQLTRIFNWFCSAAVGCRQADEPFSRGAYSSVSYGSSGEGYDALATPTHGGRVVWAGEVCAGQMLKTLMFRALSSSQLVPSFGCVMERRPLRTVSEGGRHTGSKK